MKILSHEKVINQKLKRIGIKMAICFYESSLSQNFLSIRFSFLFPFFFHFLSYNKIPMLKIQSSKFQGRIKYDGEKLFLKWMLCFAILQYKL